MECFIVDKQTLHIVRRTFAELHRLYPFNVDRLAALVARYSPTTIPLNNSTNRRHIHKNGSSVNITPYVH